MRLLLRSCEAGCSRRGNKVKEQGRDSETAVERNGEKAKPGLDWPDLMRDVQRVTLGVLMSRSVLHSWGTKH